MKRLLIATWLVVLVGLIFLQSHFNAETTTFLGITNDKGQAISFEYPVEIVELAVTEGQKVRRGAVLLKVRRGNLRSEQAILKERIHELDYKNESSRDSLQAEIKSLRARKAAEQADLDVQIQKLNAQYRTNTRLLSAITGKKSRGAEPDNPYLEQISVLKRQRSHLGRALQAQIDILQNQLDSEYRPIYARMNELKERSSELARQVTELIVAADFDGQVGNILYKPGETIDAFQPILTLHAIYPEQIKGYINENVYNRVKAGHEVWVTSVALNGDALPVKGLVDNVGNRIVEYPPRLKKNALIPAWGREVLISLERENHLLLGERVNISLSPPKPAVSDTVIAYFSNLINSYAGEGVYVSNY